jgi:pyruvate dehydrogenase (NADP+)
MFSAMKHRRDRLVSNVQEFVHEHEIHPPTNVTEDERVLVSLLREWLDVRDEKSDRPTLLYDQMKPIFERLLPAEGDPAKPTLLSKIWSERDMFPKLSQWIVGGDGWAYDIGFGGLDHVEAFEANDVNVLVVDTEMYSNTGGQQSKATPAGASVKFAIGGKKQKKKSLGEMFMTYEHVYVASVSLHDQAQTLQACLEADAHNGPSIIIAYAPCVQQGVRPQGMNDMFEECKFAVESGYWPLYRYKPSLLESGQNPFILDSRKLRKDVTDFLKRETRFMSLRKKNPQVADGLWEKMNRDVHHRMDHLQQLSAGYKKFDESGEPPVVTLFASETGNAARVARDFANACTLSGVASAMNDVELDDLNGKTVVFFIATCGQGAMPGNGKDFLKHLNCREEAFAEGTRFMVFGLGDSSYYFFCKAAKEVEARMEHLNAVKLLSLGVGDDSAEEGLEQGLHDWLETVWPALEVPAPEEVPHIHPVKVVFSERAVILPEEDEKAIAQFYSSPNVKATSASILSNEMMCRPEYNRDFRTIQISKGDQLQYELGDALEIYPHNDSFKVLEFLHEYSPDFGAQTVVKMHAFGIDGEISLHALFTYVLDVFGKPSKHFLHELATFESSEDERKTMLHPDFLKKAGKESGITVADVLRRFKNAMPPLPALLAMIPVIKPRAYSIASAPQVSTSSIELLVLIDTWWCNEGMRYGLTCDMLRKLKAGDHTWCRIKAGSMEPPLPANPVLCAGIGSGLAPHMAFLRDHVRAADAGESVGPFSLYFGNRFVKDEYLYQEELEAYAKKYEWFKLHTAFSRDDPSKKVYVQDLVGQSDDARRLLRDDDSGLMYVCGNRQLPKPLQEALVRSFSRGSDDPAEIEAAAKDMENLYLRGRAQQEVW